jgi:hypothetical protein
MPPFTERSITAEEFERQYAARSGMTVDQLRALDRVVLPCLCEEDGCEGWQMISRELAADPLIRFKAGIGPPP